MRWGAPCLLMHTHTQPLAHTTTRTHDHLHTRPLANTSIVETDPGEHFDVAKDEPAIRQALLNELLGLNTTIFNPFRGHPTYKSCVTAADNGGFYGPFAYLPDDYYTPRPPLLPQQQMEMESLKQSLKAFDNEDVRKAMAMFAKIYGRSEQAVENMHTVDACLDTSGNVMRTEYCTLGNDTNPEPYCKYVDTTLEYPDHVIPPEFK